MLLRTTSTPALMCFPKVAAEKCGEVERVDPEAASGFRRAEQKQPFNIVDARKAQSESDLQSAGAGNNHSAAASPRAACTAAAAVSRYDGTTTPQKNWSRRLGSLRRGSSLPPSIQGSKSELDSLLDELQQPTLPGLQESTAGEEDAPCSPEGPLDSARCFESESCVAGRQVSRDESYEPKPVSFPELAWDTIEAAVGSVSSVGGFGMGVGSTGGRSNSRFGGGGSYDNSSGDIDAYYQKMIKENPGNSLLLRNYARYLHEEKRDLSRAEEFYERAILASPHDTEVRARYAKLIWEFRRDEERAGCYFEQAARASPDDCDALGAYAAFLWDVENEQDSPLTLSGINQHKSK